MNGMNMWGSLKKWECKIDRNGNKCGVQNQFYLLIVKEKEIIDPKEISNNIKVFYEILWDELNGKY